jgi:hypothetical protein
VYGVDQCLTRVSIVSTPLRAELSNNSGGHAYGHANLPAPHESPGVYPDCLTAPQDLAL